MVESIDAFEQPTLGSKRLRQSGEDAFSSAAQVMKRARNVASDAFNKMPVARRYEKSFMHRDEVSYILVSQKYGLVFTASVDGYLKFWKKGQVGIEFIKTFKAHTGKITGMALTANEERLVTVCAQEQTVKLFDVQNFDVIHFMRLGFAPGECEFVSKVSSFTPILAVAELSSPPSEESQEDQAAVELVQGAIRLLKVEQVSTKLDQDEHVHSISLTELHNSQVRQIKFNLELGVAVSTDQEGNIEIWDPETYIFPEDGRLSFELFSETDYYSLAQNETFALSMSFSPDWKLLAIYSRNS